MTLSLKRTDYALDIGAARVRAFEAGKGVVLDVPVEDLADVSSIRDRAGRHSFPLGPAAVPSVA